MANSFNYACPSCKGTDSIDIAAQVFVRLVPDGTDCDLSRDGDHTWEDDSPATCGCGWVGTVKDLDGD
jgi:hypothetical protein